MTRTTPWRWITLHLSHIFFTEARTFILLRRRSFPPPAALSFQQSHNPPSRRVVRAQLHRHPVAGPNPDEVPRALAGRVRQNPGAVIQLNAPRQARQQLDHSRLSRSGAHGRVNTQGPFEVTATQCSKWAE